MGPFTSADVSLPFVQVRVRLRLRLRLRVRVRVGVGGGKADSRSSRLPPPSPGPLTLPLNPKPNPNPDASPILYISSPGHAQHRAQVPLLGIPLCAPQGGFEPPARHPNSPSSPSRHPTVGAPGRLLSPRLGIPPSAVRAALSPRRVFGVCRGPICFSAHFPPI